MIQFLDYSDVVTLDQLDLALRQANAQGVAQYLGGDYAKRTEDPAIIAGIQARGHEVMGIWVSRINGRDGGQDAQAAIAAARAGSMPSGRKIAIDIEPGIFSSFPAACISYAAAFNQAVLLAGYVPVVYGNEATVAACSDHARFIWIAHPGQADPAILPLDPAFFAGRRAVQYGSGTWNGIGFDINNSQFGLEASMKIRTLVFGGNRNVIEIDPQAQLWQHYRDGAGWHSELIAQGVSEFDAGADADVMHLHVVYQLAGGGVGDAYQAVGNGTWTTESVRQ